MIKELRISNFALIKELTIAFHEGFTVVTGETGSGKSIVLGALQLTLGGRADTGVLRDPAKKCVVELDLQLSNPAHWQSYFEELDIDFEELTTIRREINPQGKSRAFINDTPVNLAQLKDFAGSQIDIHSQHQTIQLKDKRFQLALLDSLGNKDYQDQLANYAGQFQSWKAKVAEYHALDKAWKDRILQQDYIQFQYEELKQMAWKPGEYLEIKEELESLNNAEEIVDRSSKLRAMLKDTEPSALQILNAAQVEIRKLTKAVPKFAAWEQIIDETLNSAEELYRQIEIETGDLQPDPERQNDLNIRLNNFERLLKKHQTDSEAVLLAKMEEWAKQLADLVGEEGALLDLKDNIATLEKALAQQAEAISSSRKQMWEHLATKLGDTLTKLGMQHALLKPEWHQTTDFGPKGKDELSILLKANKGSDFKPIDQVASGGELSRIMLAIKALASAMPEMETIIFDEIDTGVSGAIANNMGEILKSLSLDCQVMAITHLPQVAAKGAHHFKVHKYDLEAQDETITEMYALNDEQRVVEIAEMIAGQQVTESTIQNARELLGV